MCKPRATFYLLWQAGPHGLVFYGKGLTCLPRWFVLANTGCVGSLRSDIFLQIRFIIFQDCPTKQAAFSPEQLAPYNQLLIQPTLLFQSVILHKMLKLGFWNFKLIFLDAVFIGCNIFLLWFWLSVWIDICILTLWCLVVTKRSHILKQTCSWKLQVCLSMYDLSVTTRH